MSNTVQEISKDPLPHSDSKFQSITVEKDGGNVNLYFCKNGYQSTGVEITKWQFEALRRLVVNPEVVAMFEGEQVL
jgi:hypothetical protein